MPRIEGHFDDLHTTESLLGKAQVEGNTLIIPFQQVYPLRGHPLAAASPEHFAGKMIFEGVISSTRLVTEYLEDAHTSAESHEPREERDGPFAPVFGKVRDFAFEGVQESPEAWIDWLVRALSFAIELDT